MHKVLIIGAGFSGLSAASVLSKKRGYCEITVIDKKKTFDFLPMLPDTLGRKIPSSCLSCKIEDIARKIGFIFIRDEVIRLDLTQKSADTATQKLTYDYIIIASGSETNFYGNDNIRKYAYSLDSCADAQRLIVLLNNNNFDNYIIAGAGYTGVEAATNIKKFLNRRRNKARVALVERAPAILGQLPQWMKNYVLNNLKRMAIEVYYGHTIEKIEAGKVQLSGAKAFDNALVIWSAGVKTADFIQNLTLEKNPQGRLRVDEYLRINDVCFAIGDAGYFLHKGSYLRMAVQFAIAQGECAANNIIRSINKAGLLKYKPLDLGYIIPMANNKSCGRVLGLNLKGFLPTLLHFVMCIYRSCGIRNKVGLMKQLLA